MPNFDYAGFIQIAVEGGWRVHRIGLVYLVLRTHYTHQLDVNYGAKQSRGQRTLHKRHYILLLQNGIGTQWRSAKLRSGHQFFYGA